jgi:ABC-type phosphate transport system permease subunit
MMSVVRLMVGSMVPHVLMDLGGSMVSREYTMLMYYMMPTVMSVMRSVMRSVRHSISQGQH